MTAALVLKLTHIELPRPAALIAGLAVFVAVLGGGSLLLHSGGDEAVARLNVEGPLVHVSAGDVTEALRPLMLTPFVELDLDTVRGEVERLPWVARARIERQWPQTLRIRVWERQAFARWGERALLDSDARVFTPKADEILDSLPQLQAPAGHEREVMDAYSRLHEALADTAFAVSALTLDARGEWRALTPAGLELRLGRELPEARTRLIRGAMTDALRDRVSQLQYVDLRYTNGFAVGWKPKEPQATPPRPEGGANNG